MTILGKIIFSIILFSGYFFSIKLADRYKKIKAFNKIIILTLLSLIFYTIIINDKIILFLNQIFGISNQETGILYIFILVSFSINFIFLRKFLEMENKVNKIIKEIALKNSPKI